MFSFSVKNLFAKNSSKVSRSCHRHDPSAPPSAPILLSCSTDAYKNKTVHWWDAKTISIVGLLTPSPNVVACDGEPPFGFSVETGKSCLAEHSGEISWPTIADSEDEADQLLHDASFDSASMYSQPSACGSTGTVVIHSPSQQSVSSLAGTIIIHSPSDSSSLYSTDSEPSLITPPCYGLHCNLPILDMDMSKYSDERDAAMPFGQGPRPRRAATITHTVGDAIRMRRKGESKNTFDADTFAILMRRRENMFPHILTSIVEKEDEL